MTPEELKKLQDELAALADEARGLGTSDEDNARWTVIEKSMADITSKLTAEANAAATSIARTKTLQAAEHFLNAPATSLVQGNTKSAPRTNDKPEADERDDNAIVRTGSVKHFKTAKDAYGFGMWFLGAVCGQDSGLDYCKKNGIKIEVKGATTGLNSDAGALIPVQYSNTIIDLREKFGIFRQEVMAEPMTSESMVVPRSVGGLTAYPVGEAAAGTSSKTAWDNVELTARKWMVLTKYSSEVNEDTIVAWADRMAYEIAYAFALAEDTAGFLGDGTSTYHKITGVIPKLTGLSGTVAYIAGLVVASGNLWSEITLADFSRTKGRLPAYARQRGNAKWFCSSTFHAEVMEKLALAAGGNTAANIVNGSEQLTFLGLPVVLAQALPIVEANSQVPCLLGDLNQAVTFGDRRGITLALSEHSDFANDNIDIKGTERFDINVHDVGNADATAGNRKAGPVVGLITAAG